MYIMLISTCRYSHGTCVAKEVSLLKETALVKKRTSPKIFFGWFTVLTTSFCTLWGAGYITQGFSAMFKPIAADLKLNRAVTSVAASIGRFEGGIEAPLTGWFTDRFGPKWVMLFGCFLIGLGLILMNFINSLWTFYLVWGVIAATGQNIGLSIPVNKAISNWFVKKRGIALSVRAVFHGLATIAVLPLITYLTGTAGWRAACVIGGVVMWVIALPLILLFVKSQRPEYYGLLPDGTATESESEKEKDRVIKKGVEYAASVEEIEFTLRQAIRTPTYWFLALIFSIYSLISTPFMVHGIPMLTDMGINANKAALMFSIAGTAAIPTRLLAGFLADRVKKNQIRFLLMGCALIIAAGVISFLLKPGVAMAQVMLISFYMGFTGTNILQPVINARYFGRKSLGSISGITSTFMTPFSVGAPVFVGWVFDRTGSYIVALQVTAVIAVFVCVLLLFARPSRTPAGITDVQKFI
jgi:sugar phosphate permease